MEKTLKQILEIDYQGMAKFLILEICPYDLNKILYKSQAKIFEPITVDFKPTDIQLVQFNDFLVREISRAKNIIPGFKNYFDGEINLIIPNQLQKTSLGKQELKLYPTNNGRYWINDNLLKGFKEEILEKLKEDLANQTITNFNFTELVTNNKVIKINKRLKDLEVETPSLEVKYRLTTINKSSSDALVKTINNLRLKVVYIWSEQDLLSFTISQQKLLANKTTDRIMIYDWHDEELWITVDYLGTRQTFNLNVGMNSIYQKINQLIGWTPNHFGVIKEYLNSGISLNDRQFDDLTVLKLKTLQNKALNLFQLKDLKVKLIQAYLIILKEIQEKLYYQKGVQDLEQYQIFHFGKLSEIQDFKAFINQTMSDNENYLRKHFIYETIKTQQVVGIYHPSYEHLFTFGEWMKTRIEKQQIQLKQSTLILNQEFLLNNVYSRAAYNKQKYTSFKEKIEKH